MDGGFGNDYNDNHIDIGSVDRSVSDDIDDNVIQDNNSNIKYDVCKTATATTTNIYSNATATNDDTASTLTMDIIIIFIIVINIDITLIK